MFSYQVRSLLWITGIVSLYGIASFAIWYLGPLLGLNIYLEVILIALLLLTLPFAILINYLIRRRGRRAAAVTADASQASSVQGSTTPKRVYDELARGAEEAVQWLRSTRLGGAKSKEAVYGLPWFVVSGASASGKTSLLLGSGLDFHGLPSQRRAELKIVRPTTHCEWRITNAAVLLDTSGRYQTEGPAREEWIALAELIKRYRGTRPIDGVLVTVDAQRILRSSETEIEQQAKTLRARLDEVTRLVGIRFPVYLLFTHLDLLPGFREFFSEYKNRLDSDVWGATIPLDKAVNGHALFDVEFDQLSESLSRKRLLRLRAAAPPDRQLRIFDFPLRFAEARAKLGLLVSALFRPNPFSESPLFRGFYFTANVTEGESNAPLVGSSNEVVERSAQAVGHSYFSNRFFNEVLLHDKDLATSFLALQRRPPKLRNFVLAGAMLIVLLLLVGSLVSFLQNRALIADVVERGSRVDEIRRADFGKDPTKKDAAAARVEVEAVDSLRESLARLDDYDRNSPPLLLRFGLYSGNNINDSVRTIYFDSISQRFFNPTVTGVEHDLEEFLNGVAPRDTNTNPDAAALSDEDVLGRNYDLLKAYLMLADPQKVEPTFLANQLQSYWRKSSPPDMETVSLQQLDFYAKQAARDDAPHIRVNDKLVSDVRRKLTAYPPVNRFYKRLITDINAKTAPISLDSILEGRGRGVMTGTYTVPGSFTIDGYRNYIKAAIASASEEISKDDWVMGTTAGAGQTQATDISKLQGMYLREYTDQWRKFERSISVQQFRTKDDAVEALKVLSSPSRFPSPLSSLCFCA
jgi:type VI secretion system protein ImpL